MLSAESSLVTAAPAQTDRIFAQFAANVLSCRHTRALASAGKRSLNIHLLMVTALLLLWKLIESPNVVLILGGTVFFAGSCVIARNEARLTPVLITPLSWWFAWQAFSLGLCPIWIGSRIGAQQSIDYIGNSLSINNVMEGFIYYAIGSLAMHFGLQRSRPREAAAAAGRRGSSGSIAPIIALWVSGIFYSFFGKYLSAIGMLAAPLQWATLSAACSIAIAPPRFIPARSYIHWCAILIAIAGCLVASSVIGLKFYIMLSVLPIIWFVILKGNLRKALLVLIPAIILIYLYVVEPVIGGLRFINRSANIQSSLIEYAKTGNIGEVTALEQASVPERLDDVATRMFSGIMVGYLVQDTKVHGLKMGETMNYVLYAVIPRLFWPDKPNVSRGAWFTAYLGAASSEDTARTASALTAEGELYWNFGLVGMIAGMAALGWLIGRLMWKTAGVDPRANPIRMLAYLMTIFLVASELEAGTMFVGILASTIVLRLMIKSYELFGKPS